MTNDGRLRRALVTAGVLGALQAATLLTAPGVDAELVATLPAGGTLSPVALGTTPYVSAAVVVELVAMLRAPWRALRDGGPAGRARLDVAVRILWLAFALLQALALAASVETLALGTRSLVVEPGWAYFANSYRFDRVPPGWVGSRSTHGARFVSTLEKGNVLACQFHPELSGHWGARLLDRWLQLVEGP